MRTSTRRPRPVVDDSALASRLGSRLKQSRLKAGLTQQQLAGDRYTKAYVSALENGLVRPSMTALNFFGEQLGIAPSRLIGDDTPAWTRLEADVHLAAGRWAEAADAYTNLLETPGDPVMRAELLRGRAEAHARLDDPVPAAADAAEAVRMFTAAGKASDAALATYWLAYAQYKQENMAEARSLMRDVLDRVRGGLAVEPDFNLRLLLALSSIEAHDGDHVKSLAYLQEVRAFADQLDDRRRATYLYDLAYAYRETGDIEAAIRNGLQSLALYRASGAEFEMGALENNLALSFLANGNVARANELVANARERFARLHDDGWLAHVEDTAAQIAIAEGNAADALEKADLAMATAQRTGNQRAFASGLVTRAKALVALARIDEALASYEEAAVLVRETGPRALLRDVLGQWADELAKSGQHEKAYALTREALTAN
jgi:tetratricopeptide (TPR) repeat protein